VNFLKNVYVLLKIKKLPIFQRRKEKAHPRGTYHKAGFATDRKSSS